MQTTTTTLPRPRSRETVTALVIYAVTVLASIWLGALRPATFSAMIASSATIAAGTLAMAFYLARSTPYPRREFLIAAAVMAAGTLAGPLLFPDPTTWAEGVRPMAWMNPWFLMTMVWISPPTRARWCSPGAPWAGALLIGMSLLLTLISWGAAGFVGRG